MKTLNSIFIFVSVIFFLLKFGVAANQEVEKYTGLLKSSPLGKSTKVRHYKGFSWIQYCPDNTCEIIRTKSESKSEIQKLEVLATGYFFYVSRYIYLKQWQNDSLNQVRLYNYIQLSSLDSCKTPNQRKLVECVLKNLIFELSAELLFIRYDENHVASKRMDLEKEIETRFNGG